MIALLALLACDRCEPAEEIRADGVDQDCDGADLDIPWREVAGVAGVAADGFGHALAWDGEALVVGAPFGRPGRVWRDGAPLLTGEGFDLLGAGLASGPLLVGAPRHGEGAVLLGSGEVVLAGRGVGTTPIHHGEAIASIRANGVDSTAGDGWDEGARLWSLASVRGPGGRTLVAARADGAGLSYGGRLEPAPAGASEYGRALAACDLDGDGADELLVGVPVPGEVHVLSGGARVAVLSLGSGRAGHAIACGGGEVFVGAPESGAGREGAVAWWEHPLRGGPPTWVWRGEEPGARLGFSLALRDGGAELAAGAPGTGRARILAR